MEKYNESKKKDAYLIKISFGVLFLMSVIFCLPAYSLKSRRIRAHKPVTKEALAYKLLKKYVNDYNSGHKKRTWDGNIKIFKCGSVDTLYILPYESGEFQRHKVEAMNTSPKQDSIAYYTDEMQKAKQENNMGLYEYYSDRISRIEYIKQNSNDDMDTSLLDYNYTPDQKGWRLKCVIIRNGKKENIEVYYNTELTEITDIVSEDDAAKYEKLRHTQSLENYNSLLDEYKNHVRVF